MIKQEDLILGEYYWIILHGELLIGLYEKPFNFSHWMICGSDEIVGLDEVDEIKEHIERPR